MTPVHCRLREISVTERDAENAEVAQRVDLLREKVHLFLEVQNSPTDAILKNDFVEVYE